MVSTAAFKRVPGKTRKSSPSTPNSCSPPPKSAKGAGTSVRRCQRFDLRRVDADVLMKHLANIEARRKCRADTGGARAIIARARGKLGAQIRYRCSIRPIALPRVSARRLRAADAFGLRRPGSRRVIGPVRFLARGTIASAFQGIPRANTIPAPNRFVAASAILAECRQFSSPRQGRAGPRPTNVSVRRKTERMAPPANFAAKTVDAGRVGDCGQMLPPKGINEVQAATRAAGGWPEMVAGAHRPMSPTFGPAPPPRRSDRMLEQN